ncbi:C4-dicarboxylate ABC transporter substrate-binding protein [Gammaproteobacteria bacterium]|nr:C4-dicarboxylate ABC transporter substrate-binding protein [Gammaproteobacteria bacterium]
MLKNKSFLNKTNTIIRAMALTGLLMSASLMSSASAAINMKLSHNHGKDHPVHKAMQLFADRAKELSNGDLNIRLYPDASLGNQKDSLEQVQNGAIALAKSNAAELEAFHPAYGAFNYPYIFKDREHYYKVLQGDIGMEILNSSKDVGFIGVAYYDGGARSFYAKKPILSPEDLKGMKVRVQPSPTAVEMVKLLGANPTPLSYGELYTALQQGVVDAAENNFTALTLSRHGEVTKFFSLDEHTMIPDILVISTKVWDKLTPENQQAIRQAGAESTIKMKELWTIAENEEFLKADAMGVERVEVDKKPFQEAVKPMFETLKTSNPDTYNVIERMRALAE